MSEAEQTRRIESNPGTSPANVRDLLIPIWAERKRIFLTSLIVAAVTLGINFLLPKYYKSTATLLPETQKDKLSALGQFADIASLAGVSVPGSEIARLYPTIINSETVLRNVILKRYKTEAFQDSVDLIQYFEFNDPTPEENMAKALKTIRELLTSAFDAKTSVVSLSVEMREPQLAADVMNTIVAELDGFMRYKKFSNASEQVKWIHVRLSDIEKELKTAEDELVGFKERNRRVEGSPELLLQQERFLRNVQVKSAIYVELKKQYELAKLEEIKNITVVNVLDPGRVPVKKERPKRATNAAIAFGLTLGVLIVEVTYRKSIRAVLKAIRESKRV